MFTTFLSWSNQISFGKFINKNEAYKPEQFPYELKLSHTFITGSGLFIIYVGRKKYQYQGGKNLMIFFSFGISLMFWLYLGNVALSQREKHA